VNRLLYVCLDGLADDPIPELDGRTPLEAAETPFLVARDQRLIELRFDAALLAGEESGAVQLRRVDSASDDAKRRCEAWIAG